MQQAFQYYQMAVKECPNDFRIYQNMGINMKRQGLLDQALFYYKKAIDLEPHNSVILYNIGILFSIRSEYEDAI